MFNVPVNNSSVNWDIVYNFVGLLSTSMVEYQTPAKLQALSAREVPGSQVILFYGLSDDLTGKCWQY